MSQHNVSAQARFDAYRELGTRIPRKFEHPLDDEGNRIPVSEYYGENTFNLQQMKEKLPKDVFQKLRQTIEFGKKLENEIADTVAHAIKEWAVSKGAHHFCHWFQPQTGSTAEKHDAFLSFDDSGKTIEKFTGSQLIQSEPDASSFPSGGMRSTFEARGYTAWDPSSPIFIVDNPNGRTLCIPSVFISYHGDALDEKTGLIRSMEVISQKSTELLKLTGLDGVRRVVPTLGAEQEYFLVDRALAALRPDLILTGRTLVGGQPPKGQQLEDHYFGSIPSRVAAFMSEVEYELFKLGVPAKTRHNEVAPNQFEIAPIFEEANVSTDHNQITMEIMRKVAQKHQYTVLMHEKPFAGVNGSGKHNNWSLMVTASGSELDGMNLLEPGKTPRQNLRFLLILVSVLKGVYKHSGLIRAGIASSGNDHRLGANEAPPAIISVFMGDMLNRILDEIAHGSLVGTKDAEQAVISLGVSQIPAVAKDNTDRNRTSPFAFTGNKFEFRAVGSSASTAFPMTLLNAVVADGMTEVITALKAELKASGKPEESILKVVKKFALETEKIRFEGNGYSEDWVIEARKRGLPNLQKSPEALAQMVEASSISLLSGLGIFSEAEIKARYHIRLERFIKNLSIEVDTLKSMVDTQILPAGYNYAGHLADSLLKVKAAGINPAQTQDLATLNNCLTELQLGRAKLNQLTEKVEKASTEEAKAELYSKEISEAMLEVRKASDTLESIISDDFWPLPKYREMLFSV